MYTTPRVTQALERLKGIFLEVPGTRLSLTDAARVSGLELSVCGVVLQALENVRFLRRDRNGLFIRALP
jgi:DNA-binding IclR family transcriptional regulator